MLFNTTGFLFFLIAVFAIYWILHRQHKFQNGFLLVASYYFYSCWDWRFLLLIVVSSATDFLVGLRLGKTEELSLRRLWLTLSVVVNLGLLGFFKYFNFFIESFQLFLNSIGFHTSEISLSVILPVGISFYTFRTLSYTIDVYRKKIEPNTNWIEFFTFVSFFPQLVAGPIERASNLLPQFEQPRTFDFLLAVRGMRLILWGLFKKMVIADRLSVIVDSIYENPSGCDSPMVLLAAILFAYQVYCDFSGYSDIAIGSGRLFGFQLMRNFVTPFLSGSMSELWQRWHISLSTWFRDYVYFPLGGNQVGVLRWAFNTIVTFIVSGLWHGADAHFVIWGFSYSIPLIIERQFKLKRIGVLPTFLLFAILGIFFRSPNISVASTMFSRLFSLDFSLIGQAIFNDEMSQWALTLTLLLFFVLAECLMGRIEVDEYIDRFGKFIRWVFYYTIVVSILLFGVMDNAPQFIYFQF